MSVKYGILAVLNRRSLHGYQLRREMASDLGPEWLVNLGQIYSTLDRLVRDDLVVQSETVPSADAPDKKLYTITPAGRAELNRWFMAPVENLGTGRDDLYAKVMLSLTSEVSSEAVIQAQRKGHLRRIALLTELKEQLDPNLELPAILQADLSIGKTDAALKWLDSAEVRIRAAKGQELPPTRTHTPVGTDNARSEAETPSESEGDKVEERSRR